MVRFNGAAFSRTRKLDSRRLQPVVVVSASMGPRSHERGNWVPLFRPSRHRPASMGPRSHERGNPEAPVVGWLQPFASMGPRSHERGNARGEGRAGSGGQGASMGPRSHERGNMGLKTLRENLVMALQWGRVLTNAETSLVRERYAKGCLLQWGRVLTNAETHCDGMVRNYAHDASMGPRSHERGNSPIRRCRGSRRTRFNGAAFSRTRKLPGLGCGFDQGFVASMGPRSHERGNPSILDRCHVDGVASMGPRSHERGNASPPYLKIRETRRFNGAAFSRTRKPDVVAEVRGKILTASMGPRSHERGNLSRGWTELESRSLQWGRVLTNAETSSARQERLRSLVRFNGAAFSRTRKPGNPPPGVGKSGLASMGPRSHERGNA